MTTRWAVSCLLLAAWMGLTAASLRAQESQPATSAPAEPPPAVPHPGNAPKSGSLYEEFPEGMTLEQAITRAYELIEVAEAKGEGALDAFKRVDSLLGFVRAKDSGNADADFLFGRTHLLLGRPREAMQYIERYASSQKGSNDWLAYRFLGDLYLDAKYNTMARDKYRKATELSPSEPVPHAGVAKTELQLGRWSVAEEHARKAVELDSVKPEAQRDPLFYSVLAEALLGEAKLEEASSAATRAAELGRALAKSDPADATLLEKLDEYQSLLEKVVRGLIRTFPERTQEYVRLARVLRERADVNHLLKYHNVLVTIQTAMDRAGANTPPALVLEQARLLYEVGDIAKARTVLEELLVRQPQNAEARKLLNEISGPAPAEEAAAAEQ